MNQDLLKLVSQVAILLPAFIAVFTFRGFFRALVAKWMGDTTAYEEEFVTLNPLAHIDVMGLVTFVGLIVVLGAIFTGGFTHIILMSLMILAGIRCTYPVPVDSSRFRSPRSGIILTAIAGSLGTFVLAALMLILMQYSHFVWPASFILPVAALKPLIEVAAVTTKYAIIWGVLQLVPLPPFDGGEILHAFVSPENYDSIEWLETNSIYIFLLLVVVPGISDVFFRFIQLIAFKIEILLYLIICLPLFLLGG